MKIYIPTCNQSTYLVEALLYSLNKYWFDYDNHKVVILGYDKPKFKLGDNVSFYSMGKHDPIEEWSTDLKKYFENVDDEYFIYMNDDGPLSKKIDSQLINLFYDILSQNKDSKIGRIGLTQDISRRGHDEIGDYGDFKLIEAHQNSQYRTSTQFSIWSREYFLKYLKNSQTPWQFELQHPINDGYRVLATKNKYCLDFYHLQRKGARMSDDWDLSVYDRKKMVDNIEDYNFIKNIMEQGGLI